MAEESKKSLESVYAELASVREKLQRIISLHDKDVKTFEILEKIITVHDSNYGQAVKSFFSFFNAGIEEKKQLFKAWILSKVIRKKEFLERLFAASSCSAIPDLPERAPMLNDLQFSFNDPATKGIELGLKLHFASEEYDKELALMNKLFNLKPNEYALTLAIDNPSAVSNVEEGLKSIVKRYWVHPS